MLLFKKFFKRCPKFNIFAIIIGSIGLGMLAVIILPFWIWVLCVGIGCIFYAFTWWLK